MVALLHNPGSNAESRSNSMTKEIRGHALPRDVDVHEIAQRL